MPLLYYWRPDNYRQDREFGFGFHLNQNSPAMLRTAPGDSLWAFTRRRDGFYVLAAHLIVRGISHNVPGYIIWISRGGEDELENMCLICPNHHAAIHTDDAIFDYRGLEFRFGSGLIEKIRLNHHLKPVAFP